LTRLSSIDFASESSKRLSVELLRPTLAFIPQVICLQGVFRLFPGTTKKKK